ncbi:hypothetical protein ACFL0N_04945 [Pseudomonadota bacterium]|jgi:hypothetical protein
MTDKAGFEEGCTASFRLTGLGIFPRPHFLQKLLDLLGERLKRF